ncbi:MAG TPA: pilus assembly protein PilM [Gammaproteobacteria bacterium]|nr:pilus assembly protein PilM [Gammaproteobacteria bacterium]
MLFRRRHRPLIGLDISSTAVKLVELSGNREKMRVDAYAAVGLPPNCVVEKQVAEPEAVGDAIRRAVKLAGTRNKQAVAAVGGASVITKVITMPAGLKDQEMEEQIRVEADQHIPYPLEDVGLDFEVLGPTEDEESMVNVLLAACRADDIESRVAAIELGGLECKIMDIDAFALENACHLLTHQMINEGRDQTVAVIDIGATTTTMNVLHDGKIVYTRDQAFGGKQLTEDIMNHYGLSFEEAGKAKKQGGLPDNYESEILKPFTQDTIQQINRALQFFFSSNSDIDRVDQILVAGGCANIEGLERAVQDELEIPAEIAAPFAAMSIAARAKPRQLRADGPALMAACGLSMRSFD